MGVDDLGEFYFLMDLAFGYVAHRLENGELEDDVSGPDYIRITDKYLNHFQNCLSDENPRGRLDSRVAYSEEFLPVLRLIDPSIENRVGKRRASFLSAEISMIRSHLLSLAGNNEGVEINGYNGKFKKFIFGVNEIFEEKYKREMGEIGSDMSFSLSDTSEFS